jgi:hypothetical protein
MSFKPNRFASAIAVATTIAILFTCVTGVGHAQDTGESLGKQIAKAHGMYPLPEFDSITYTFNAQVGEKNIQRTWTWWPQENKVKDHSAELTYTRDQINDSATESDKKFINDHYWLFFPWHLATDTDVTLSAPVQDTSVLQRVPLTKVTAAYDAEGGYTPGDAYDVYMDATGIIREWAFRKSGAMDVTRSSTWDDYQFIGGMRLSLDRVGTDGFRVWFTDVDVQL